MKMNFYKTYLAMLVVAASIMLPSPAFAQCNGSNALPQQFAPYDNRPADCSLNLAEKAKMPEEVRKEYEAFSRFFSGVGESSGSVGTTREFDWNTEVKNIRDQLRAETRQDSGEIEVGRFNGGAAISANNLGTGCSASDFADLITAELDGIGELDGKQMIDEFAAYAKTALMKEAMTMLFSSPAISAVMDGIKATANARMSMMKNSCNAREIMESARGKVDQANIAEAISYCKQHAAGTLKSDKIPLDGSGNPVTAQPKEKSSVTCTQPSNYEIYAENYFYQFNHSADLHSQLCLTTEEIKCNRCKDDSPSCRFAPGCDQTAPKVDPKEKCSWLFLVSNVKVDANASGGVAAHERRFSPKQLRIAGMEGAIDFIGNSLGSVLDYVGLPFKTPEQIYNENRADIDKSYKEDSVLRLQYGSDEKLVPVQCFCSGGPSSIYQRIMDQKLTYTIPDGLSAQCSDYATMINNAGNLNQQSSLVQEMKKATACIFYQTMNPQTMYMMESYLTFNKNRDFYKSISILASSEATAEIYERVKDELDIQVEKARAANSVAEVSDDRMDTKIFENLLKQQKDAERTIKSAKSSAKNDTKYSSLSDVMAAINFEIEKSKADSSVVSRAGDGVTDFLQKEFDF